jgi:hypothetical protein
MKRIIGVLIACILLSCSPDTAPSPSTEPAATPVVAEDEKPHWRQSGMAWESIRSLAISQSDPKVVYAGTGFDVYRSSDGADSWIERPYLFAGYSLAIDPYKPDIVYSGRFGYEPIKTVNGGASWTELPSIGCSAHTAICIDQLHADTLYIGISGGWGLWKSINGGLAFEQLLSNIDIYSCAIDPANPSIIFVGTKDYYGVLGGILKSTDSGSTWTRVMTNPFVRAIAIDPTDPAILFAGTKDSGVFRSKDEGLTWTAANDALSCLEVRALAIFGSDPDTLYCGTWGGGVYKSVDGGSTWSEMNGGFPAALQVTSLAIDPKVPDHLYAGTDGNGVYKYY